ncbi:MAG: hypothetical protein VB875_04250, partial [Pirellulales bacterium]
KQRFEKTLAELNRPPATPLPHLFSPFHQSRKTHSVEGGSKHSTVAQRPVAFDGKVKEVG